VVLQSPITVIILVFSFYAFSTIYVLASLWFENKRQDEDHLRQEAKLNKISATDERQDSESKLFNQQLEENEIVDNDQEKQIKKLLADNEKQQSQIDLLLSLIKNEQKRKNNA